MCNFTCLLVALCISASTLFAADPNGQQLNTSEKQQAGKQGTQNPEAYVLYLKGLLLEQANPLGP